MADGVYQGLTRVTAPVDRVAATVRVPAGTLWVPADQPDFAVAAALLEPDAPDSLFAWGLLSTLLETREYIEPRVLEPLVREMLAAEPETAAAWKAALEDPDFAADPRARWAWWYRRTPYFAAQEPAYPVLRAVVRPVLETVPWPALPPGAGPPPAPAPAPPPAAGGRRG